MKFFLKILFLVFILFSFNYSQNIIDKRPYDFVNVKEVIPDIIVELRYYGDHNFIGKRIDGYEKEICYLTKAAAESLAKVQEELRKFNLTLKIYDGYRPQRAVNHFIRWAKDLSDTLMKKEFYPTIDKKDLIKDGYIAEKSSHSRGSTVDLTIVPIPVPEQDSFNIKSELCECFLPINRRFKDNSIDMGSGYDCFHPISHTINNNLELNQRINRLLLKTIMEKYGFKNYPLEWWHFTLINEPYPNTYFDFVIE
ncbi:MAG: M15 family metallopeptidase [Ignavibacterium sp.]|nr:M15 family metallopeptidase [Ignavibacterium sp.]